MKPAMMELIRREAYVQGYIQARNPSNAYDTLKLLVEADNEYLEWRKIRDLDD